MTCSYALLDFFKVSTIELSKFNLAKLDGDTIRHQFVEQIVPQSDKEMVRRREKTHASFYYNSDFKYEYQKNNNCILITYKWKISGDFFIRIINKMYTAKLDLASYKLT